MSPLKIVMIVEELRENAPPHPARAGWENCIDTLVLLLCKYYEDEIDFSALLDWNEED